MAVGTMRRHLSKGNFKMVSFRVSRSLLNHPFLMILLLFLIFLHRYFPFLLSLLVTASPVLICTAFLLGTLLIYGKPNQHNVNSHDEMSYNNTPATPRSVAESHTSSIDRKGMFSKDIFAEVRNDIVEKGMRSPLGMLGSGVRVDVDSSEKLNWGFDSPNFGKGTQIHQVEKSQNDYGFANFENFDQGYDKSITVYQDGQDGFEFSPGQKKLDDEAVHDECLDCESDGGEQSSFDALVADVIATAQETHPLLDSQDPLHADAPHDDGSLKFEFESLDSNQSSEDSGEDENDDQIVEDKSLEDKENRDNITNAWMEMEKSQYLESLITKTCTEDEMEDDEGTDGVDIDEDVEDDDDGENTDVEKDVTKHVTIWTEEDEKNLRLVGNSELERDLRLENLLARRRAKRNFSMISEKNFIDMDRPDPGSLQVPNISTTKVNPFDTPHDTNHEHFSSITPMSRSVSSVTVPKKNPFDSPCAPLKKIQHLTEEISKGKPLEMNSNNNADEFRVTGSSSSGFNHTGNVLKPQFGEMNRKDAVFRRYDSFSFSTGYNFLGDDFRQSETMEIDRRNARLKRRETFNARSTFSNAVGTLQKLSSMKMKPVFVTEEVDRDQGPRHFSSGRDSSHDSESSVRSSESDIEHVRTSKDREAHFEHSLDKEGNSEDHHASTQSDDSNSKSSEKVPSPHDDLEEGNSSSEVNSEVNADKNYQKIEDSDENHDNGSGCSISVSSEVVHSSEKEGEDEDKTVKESVLTSKASANVSDAITEPPVFDSSPSGIEKITPFSSSPTHG